MQCVNQMDSGSFKRKRKSSSDSSSNIENVPLKEEKRQKLERMTVTREEQSSSPQMGDALFFVDERVPLTELNIANITSSSESLTLEDTDSPLQSDTESDSTSLNNLMLELEQITDDCVMKNSLVETQAKVKINKPKVNSPPPSTSKMVILPKTGGKLCPLPSLDWSDESILWDFLCKKDVETCNARNSDYFTLHPGIHYRMRSVLLEWILEVCAVYKLQRETYFITVDLLDRYLSSTKNVSKKNLQLIGVSCLFIASKIEEIYPPKLTELAYVTDGACLESEILVMELKIMKTLKWCSSVVSPNAWLNMLLQILYHNEDCEKELEMRFALFPTQLFDSASQLLDLCSLDEGFLKYSYKTIAVSSLYISCAKDHSLTISGMSAEDISQCVTWMKSFWQVLKTHCGLEAFEYDTNLVPNSPSKLNVKYNTLQNSVCKHNVNLDLLEAAQTILKENQDLDESIGLPTPPLSTKKKCNP